MKLSVLAAVPAAIALSIGMGLAAQAPAAGSQPALAIGTRINARLKTTLDAHKARVGDRVLAVVSGNVKQDGRVVLLKGTKLFGHVTEVTAPTRGHVASSLGVAFDTAVTKHGQRIPIAAGISGVYRMASTFEEPAAMGPMDSPGMEPQMPNAGMTGGGALGTTGARGGVVGGVTAPVGATVNGAVGAAGELGADANRGGGLLATAQAGLRGSNGTPLTIVMPSLASMARGTAQGSVLEAPRGDVRLNSGSDVQLETLGTGASGQVQASGSASRSR